MKLRWKPPRFLTFEVSHNPVRASRQVLAVPLFETGA
jgi:hypothetical protein